MIHLLSIKSSIKLKFVSSLIRRVNSFDKLNLLKFLAKYLILSMDGISLCIWVTRFIVVKKNVYLIYLYANKLVAQLGLLFISIKMGFKLLSKMKSYARN